MRLPASLFACLLLLTGCASLPDGVAQRSTPEARALLEASAKAHGWERYQTLKDINASYQGQWFSLVKRLQPVLVDDQFRGSSQERMIRSPRFIGQTHVGDGGVKQVARASGPADVWYNGSVDSDAEKRAAAALVTDGYRLFLLGPMYLMERDTPDAMVLELAGTETINGVECDRLLARIRPGLGLAAEDRMMLWIGKSDRVARRVWFTLDGLDSTKGALAEVEMSDHRRIAGVLWPTRFFEKIHRPLKLDVHRWTLTGLDVDRGYSRADIEGVAFRGAAVAPANRLP